MRSDVIYVSDVPKRLSLPLSPHLLLLHEIRPRLVMTYKLSNFTLNISSYTHLGLGKIEGLTFMNVP